MKKESDLRYLDPEEIERNPQNPRIFFDEKRLNELQESINELGILVPLIVYYDDQKNKFLLLDGERRLISAKVLGIKKVPTNVISKPTKLQNILQMFNIHNVRIEWGPMEVAWKVKTIMDDTKIAKESELARLTSLKPMEIRKSKILLSFDEKYQNLVHLTPKRGGIKQDFLVELNPTLNWIGKELPSVKKNRLIDALIEKHKINVIKNYVSGFRQLSKMVRSGLNKRKIEQIFQNLIEKEGYDLDDAFEVSVREQMDLKDIEKRSKRLLDLLEKFKTIKKDSDSSSLFKTLKKLNSLLESILKNDK